MKNIPDIIGREWEIVQQISSNHYESIYEIQRNNFGSVEKAALKVVSVSQNHESTGSSYVNGFSEEDVTIPFCYNQETIIKEYALMKNIKGHGNIVYYDDLVYQPHKDGLGWDIYVKMELLTPILSALPDEITPSQVVHLGKDICKALIVCQNHNLIHRDVTPQSIFLSSNGDYKLGNFIFATADDQTSSSVSTGNLQFVTPEIYNSKSYSFNMDIYSLGLVMYWMLNGRRLPFAELPSEECNTTMDVKATDRRCSGGKIVDPINGSDALKKIVLKACAFDPADRYETAEQMLEALDSLNEEDLVAPVISKNNSQKKFFQKVKEFFQANPSRKWKVLAIVECALILTCLLFFCTSKHDKLVILQQPIAQSVKEGESVQLQVEATGDELTYQWMVAKEGSNAYDFIDCTESVCSIVLNESTNGSKVYCVITDAHGNSVNTNTLTLSMISELQITVQPKDTSVSPGSVAKVSVTAKGQSLAYEWYYKNADSSKFKKSSTVKTDTYAVEMNKERNGRQLYCVITDAYGNTVTSNTVTISATSSLKITKQPVDTAVIEGKKAEVTVKVIGEGLTYEWYYKSAGSSEFKRSSTVKSNTYVVEMTKDRDGRQLYCVITDDYGNTVTTNTVTMSMISPVKITKQPVDVVVAKGSQAVVTVTASGEELTYEWYYKNADSSEFKKSSTVKSNTYAVEMTKARDGRQLYCVITDAYGNTVTTKTVTISMK